MAKKVASTNLGANDRAHRAAAVPDSAAFAVLDAPLSEGHPLVVAAVSKYHGVVRHG